ncbi:MAG: sigma-70 family RNA polymerase sigma factor [Pirellulaceae bacterium]|nr:sigma-70 family RNA polymerase sigma factor [Pirellulaceae bacterium]
MNEVTQVLNEIGTGGRQNAASLLPLVYEELKRMANQKMADEAAGNTLSATALVHEAYLKLAGHDDQVRWESRVHFFRAAAEAMRRILIDRARSKHTLKRGDGIKRIALNERELAENQGLEQLLELNEALSHLEQKEPKIAELVKLRFFVGMTGDEAAKMLEISPRTADAWWSYAKAYLAARLMDSMA